MLLRAIIIDDEQKGIDTLNLLIGMFIPDIKVVAQSTKAVEAMELIENYKPEIVFLDINMPEMSGFELLEKLNWRDFNLVFTTAHQEYALKALKSNAIDYLLKPIDHEDLRSAIDKIKQHLTSTNSEKFNYNELRSAIHKTQKQRILVNSRTDVESIDITEIIYLESRSNYTIIHLDSREVLTSKTLKDFDMQLCVEGSGFMRVHHSFIINLSKVARYLKASDCVVMTGDQKIPVAKSKREVFFKWLNI